MGDKREARYKLFRINPNQVLAMLNWNTHQSIALPITKGIPEGAHVEHVNYYPDRMVFMATVYHDSFDILPDGELLLMSDDWLEMEERVVSVDAYKMALGLKQGGIAAGVGSEDKTPVLLEPGELHMTKGAAGLMGHDVSCIDGDDQTVVCIRDGECWTLYD